jgi:ubiquinone/menaquinone biosynthesis C-methylase UbiE
MFIAALKSYKALSQNRSRHIAEEIAPLLDGCETVLDFGCGNFYTANILHGIKPRLSITGIDVVRDQNLSLDSTEGLKFKVYDGQSIPFEENTFDGIVAAAVLHHTPNPEFFLDEFIRVAKPGGKVVIVEEMYLNPLDRIWISWQDWMLNKMKKGIPVPLQFRSHRHYLKEFDKRALHIESEDFVRPGFPFQHHYVFCLRVNKGS